MATMRFKLGEFERRMTDTSSTSIKDCELEIEFELSELPSIIKEVPTVISSLSAAADKSNSRDWERLCNEVNETKDKLCESERNLRGAEARAEAAEKKAQRKQDEVDELRKKFTAK